MFASAATIAFFLLLVVAACIDARWRRFPNQLAVACAVAAVIAVFVGGGGREVVTRVAVSAFVCGALVLLELLWRHVRGAAGLGLGDIKALFSLLIYNPVAGMLSFGVSLVLLAGACMVTKHGSLPLLPFLVPVFAILCVGVV